MSLIMSDALCSAWNNFEMTFLGLSSILALKFQYFKVDNMYDKSVKSTSKTLRSLSTL